MVRASLLLLLLLACLGPAAARAEEPAEGSDRVEEAKRLFREGVEIFSAGDRERALDRFLRSRALYPSVQNTSNAAICLDELGRYDEALEMYERLLVEFEGSLDERDRAAIGPAMAALRPKVGNVFVSANVAEARVVIDGRARGELPLTVPIRVLPGKRVIRVIKNGYVTWEATREVEQGKDLRVDAKLEPLAQAGLLRVEDSQAGTDVFVDGAPMGASPWEGTLGPGAHVVWTAKDDVGSAPKRVVVVQGQTAMVRLSSGPLGPPVKLVVRPETAALRLGDADLGKGSWRGRLPAGSYRVRASEAGYFSGEKELVVSEGGRALELALELEVDPDHPRWPKSAGQGFVQAFGGVAFGPGLASDAESSCQLCPDGTSTLGLMVGGRGGYRFDFGLALELSAGYLRLASQFSRESTLDDQPGVSYPLADDLLLHGPFVGFGLGYRYVAAELVGLGARASAGAFFESASDSIDAQATRNGEAAAIAIDDPEPVSRSVSVFVHGELGVELLVGGFSIGAAMGVVVFVTEGAALDQRRTSLALSCDPAAPDGVGCVRTGSPLPDERIHDVFFVAVPQLQLGYAF